MTPAGGYCSLAWPRALRLGWAPGLLVSFPSPSPFLYVLSAVRCGSVDAPISGVRPKNQQPYRYPQQRHSTTVASLSRVRAARVLRLASGCHGSRLSHGRCPTGTLVLSLEERLYATELFKLDVADARLLLRAGTSGECFLRVCAVPVGDVRQLVLRQDERKSAPSVATAWSVTLLVRECGHARSTGHVVEPKLQGRCSTHHGTSCGKEAKVVLQERVSARIAKQVVFTTAHVRQFTEVLESPGHVHSRQRDVVFRCCRGLESWPMGRWRVP